MPSPREQALIPALIALAFACPPLAAQTFDRFFTTASERLLLDQTRQEFHDPAPAPAPVVEAPVIESAPRGPVVPQITLSGVVIRGRGQDTTWINGSGIRPDELTPEGIRVQPERGAQTRVQIVLPETAEPIRLLPGQKIDLATGAVLDAYEREPSGDGRSVFEGLGTSGTGTTPRSGGDPVSPPEPPAASGG